MLVAEDNPVNQIVATEMLRKRGVPVEIAVDGREAVAKVLAGVVRGRADGLPDAGARRLRGHARAARAAA